MRSIILLLMSVIGISAQMPPIEPGVSHELAKWRAARYSDVRYKLNLTLEKMSPVLKGTMEIRVNISPGMQAPSPANAGSSGVTNIPIILDWRVLAGHAKHSTISNVVINGETARFLAYNDFTLDKLDSYYSEYADHLIMWRPIREGENVIKLDFTSPILTSGSAITRYVDKGDGAEYIYSLFVPSDASTAFPVFDQPDLKARFTLSIQKPIAWTVVSNAREDTRGLSVYIDPPPGVEPMNFSVFYETKPISTYVFAFAAGPFERVSEPGAIATGFRPSGSAGDANRAVSTTAPSGEAKNPVAIAPGSDLSTAIFVRKSQADKFKPHAAEVFRLNREGIKFLEQYFDYKFPFPKYDLVLIPEFPFGGMEHAGATFLRESSIIFPTEPTKSDHISRANLIFHEAAHQWFGDTVTMKWFDDLWLKEGFAEFMAYKTLEKVMPEANAWKVFFERNKQAAYLTDSTRGTTPIYQKIDNLSSAKSAYGNIVYRKAPSFLKQAEFYLGPEKFQTAVRAFLKKHEYENAGWEDLVKEFGSASNQNLSNWATTWVKQQGLPTFRLCIGDYSRSVKFTGHPGEINLLFSQSGFSCYPPTNRQSNAPIWPEALQFYYVMADGSTRIEKVLLGKNDREIEEVWGYNFGGRESKQSQKNLAAPKFVFTNYEDHGYGIFLLDDKSRDYVLKNIQNEKDAFLRSMMWGALWDSVREGELDPKEYVELAIKQLGVQSASFSSSSSPRKTQAKACTLNCSETDETIIQSLLGRVSTALNYYIADGVSSPHVSKGSTRPTNNVEPSLTVGLRTRFEAVLLDRLQNAPTAGQRITFFRAFVANASTAKGREVLKQMLEQAKQPSGGRLSLRTKDRFDIVQRLIILGDPDALKLLADLEKTETTDDAKRYAYAARAGIATAENKAKYWNDFTNNKDISESWVEAAFGPWNSIRHSSLTLPYLLRALQELPNHKRNRKIFFINGWLAAFIGGQRSDAALATVNKFLTDNPTLDRDLRLKILENADLIERAVKIRGKYR